MSVQFIKTAAGRLAVLPEEEYLGLVEAVEDAADSAAVERYRTRLASGEDEALPAGLVKRLIEGESPVRVWRDHRGMSARALAEKAGLSQAYVSQIEGEKREGSVAAIKAIAQALGVMIDDLV